ncbi:MAG: hypothetical protein IT561_10925 [Alphaproteobacteria bacterium]|nr:hypothetical protein [Alphaproteobacteria bacterium]
MRAVLAALAAGLLAAAAPVGAQAPAPAETAILWSAGDGRTFRVQVPADEWQRFGERRERRIAFEHERLRSMSDTMIALEVAAVFLRLSERIPIYTDWVYGWLESYVATYLVAERAIALWLGLGEGSQPVPLGDAVSQGLHQVVDRRFEEMVVTPAAIDDALEVAVARTGATLSHEWRRVAAADRRELDAFVARHAAGAVSVPAPAGLACTAEVSDLPALSTNGPVAKERLEPDQSDLYAMRFARPYAARITIVGMRVLGGGGVLATAGLLGMGLGGGPIAAAVSGTALIWTLDYLVNRVDAISHRGDFEQRLVAALADTQREIAGEIGAQAAALLDQARDRLTGCVVMASAARATP